MKYYFVAGFDFGTSYSKVVLRDLLTGVAKVVCFDGTDGALLPSYVSVGPGRVAGPDADQEKILLSYPKLIAADAASNRNDFASLYGDRLNAVEKFLGTSSLKQVAAVLLTRYFLSALNGIREFIRKDEDWGGFDPGRDLIAVQLAVPSGLTTADGGTDALMQESMVAALQLQDEAASPVAVSTAEELRRTLRGIKELSIEERERLNQRCITYPEVAAGVQAVLRSPNTPDGKYITLDVGAGTVDLNAFLRQSPKDSDARTLDYWSCEVRPLGFARLKVTGPPRNMPAHEVAVSPLAELALMGDLDRAIGDLMRGAFRHQPFRVRGSSLSPWSHDTYVYIWGGGSAHPPYEKALITGLAKQGINQIGVNRLPSPGDGLVITPDVSFGRLAIAYGLSFHQANLEQVRLPHQIKTFEQLHPDYWRDSISAEKLCSCQGNPACERCHGTGFTRSDLVFLHQWQTVSLPAAASARTPWIPPKTRFHHSLESCLKRFHNLPYGPGMLVEQYLLICRVKLLNERPEIRDGELLRQEATAVLNHNVAEFSGQVRVLRYSAERVTGGCRCLVVRRRPAVPEDIVISAADPQQLLDWVNQEGGRKYVDCWCAIERTERREFRLVLTSLKRPASGRPPRRNRRNQRPRPKPNRRRKELKK